MDKPTPTKGQLKDPHYYLNRELSMLEFIYRVLTLAHNPTTPLLERLNYLIIVSMNLDEFFEIRVAALKRQASLGSFHPGPDSLSSEQVLDAISDFTHDLVTKQYQLLNEVVFPSLQKAKIQFTPRERWNDELGAWIKKYFQNDVKPLLSPVALDVAHPFPKLVNKSLNFFVSLSGKDAFGRDCKYAIIHVPRSLPRIQAIPSELNKSGHQFIYLNEIIVAYVKELFPGMQINGCYHFRLTRDSELALDEESLEDLPNALKSELFAQRYGHAVRLELAANCPEEIANFILQQHDLQERDLYRIDGPVNLNRYRTLLSLIDREDLKFPTLIPAIPKRLQQNSSIFDVIRQKDILLHHPFESFMPVIDLIRQATMDPAVRAIKTTLYRTGANSSMVNALVDAARAGKEITAIVELRARFDEADNIELANRLHEAGALVVYGVMGYKTHAKMTLIVRHTGKTLERFVHLGTGNYHELNAKRYTDFGLLTHDEEITLDVQNLFQQLTGMCKVIKLKKLIHAPFTLFGRLTELVEQEIQHVKAGSKGHIMAKVNGLTDRKVIRSLYRASQAGVKIDLIVRGVCCLRPGVKGISDNITVRSIVGRFLEHTRIYYFHNDGDELVYCSSADWMERNLFKRVEICFPIQDKSLASRVKNDGLLLYLQDNCTSWKLSSNGSYRANKHPHDKAVNAQLELLKKFQ